MFSSGPQFPHLKNDVIICTLQELCVNEMSALQEVGAQ